MQEARAVLSYVQHLPRQLSTAGENCAGHLSQAVGELCRILLHSGLHSLDQVFWWLGFWHLWLCSGFAGEWSANQDPTFFKGELEKERDLFGCCLFYCLWDEPSHPACTAVTALYTLIVVYKHSRFLFSSGLVLSGSIQSVNREVWPGQRSRSFQAWPWRLLLWWAGSESMLIMTSCILFLRLMWQCAYYINVAGHPLPHALWHSLCRGWWSISQVLCHCPPGTAIHANTQAGHVRVMTISD